MGPLPGGCNTVWITNPTTHDMLEMCMTAHSSDAARERVKIMVIARQQYAVHRRTQMPKILHSAVVALFLSDPYCAVPAAEVTRPLLSSWQSPHPGTPTTLLVFESIFAAGTPMAKAHPHPAVASGRHPTWRVRCVRPSSEQRTTRHYKLGITSCQYRKPAHQWEGSRTLNSIQN
jgi:hypothetical protein